MVKQFENVSCKYGAPMGRHAVPDLDTTRGTVRLFAVRLDSGGYDDGGAYWGYGGGRLYCAVDRHGDMQFTRSTSRAMAAYQLDIPFPSLANPPQDWRGTLLLWKASDAFTSNLEGYAHACDVVEREPRGGMRVSIVHTDTCLPDYFSGDSRPWVAIPAYRQTFASVRRALRDEIRQGAIGGNDDNARLLSADLVRPDEEKRADELTRKVYAAIARDIRPAKKGDRLAFRDVELPEDGDCVMAYFVIVVEED